MGCVVLFQIHCTSSTPSAGRPLPPPSRACPTPPQWCEPDPCIDLMTFHLLFHISNPDTHSCFPRCHHGSGGELREGDQYVSASSRGFHLLFPVETLCILLSAILPFLLVTAVKRAEEMMPRRGEEWFRKQTHVPNVSTDCNSFLPIINICVLC